MNRFLKYPLLLLPFCMIVYGFSAERTNILLIMSDDMGYSDLGCYGGEIQTPSLDHLAANGVRFTQFYNTARCCPTRASLLTGLHPHQAGMGHMTEDRHLPGYRGELLPSCVTIAEVLKPEGYAAYAVGKWHVMGSQGGLMNKTNWPTSRGFDKYYGIIAGATNYFEPATLVRNETPVSPLADPEYSPAGTYYLTDALSDNAVRYIKDHKQENPQKPFFLYLAYTAAHWPMQALPEDIAKYKHKYDGGYEPVREARRDRMIKAGLLNRDWELSPQAENWENVKDKNWESACMEVYAAMIDRMDQGIGRIVQALKETGQYENTVILFLQDNGACAEGTGRQPRKDYPNRVSEPVYRPYSPETVIFQREDDKRTRDGFPVIQGNLVMPGDKDTFIAYGRGWANVSNTPFREYKHWVHEGGISTPLIIHAPSLMKDSMKGKFYREYGQLVDIMTTCADLAGAEYPKQRHGIEVTPMQGTSLKPALEGKSLERTVPLFWEHEGNRAVRDGKWKLVAKGPDGDWELYDMESDRSEMHNLAAQNPQIAEKMEKQWKDWAVRSHVLPWPWESKLSAKDKEKGIKLELLFGEGNGLPKDTSGNAVSYTVKGNPVTVEMAGKSASRFDGGTWLEVEKKPALNCAGTPWFADVEIYGDDADGVILSQGGLVHGYSLYVKDGCPGFGVRIDGTLFQITSEKTLKGWTRLSAGITSEKTIQIRVDGQTVAEKPIDQFITGNPVDNMVVASDLKGQVIEPAVNPFTGVLKRITVYRGALFR
ncbi:MAG: arylsulfatase [Planctomycetaceae bacterium]|jgi:arylsulfatase|nr:arylsulfatase [Planctomycetaceae bacterium]